MAGVQIDITGAVRLALKPLLSTARRIHVLLQLPHHVDALSSEMEELRDIKADIQADALAQGEPATTTLTNQARRWMHTVNSLEEELIELESSLASKSSSLGGSWTRYKLSRRTTRMLKRARELQEKGKRFHTCKTFSSSTVDAVEAVPSSSASMVGGARALSEILQHLADDSVGIVGIYGMGGVGKTTLLTKINNELLAVGAPQFDVVMWVTVSRDASVLAMQMDMLARLGVARSVEGLEKPDQGDLRAKVLFRVLSTKRFLLLLDDMWEKLDWREVGIPYPSPKNRCKVLFTTRSKEVCAGMDAQRKVKVNVLSEAESWELFCDKVGAEGDQLGDPSIRNLAWRLAAKCGGLPLALITVGRAMADARTVGEWEEAIEVLSEAPEKLPGMEDEVLSLLKFSLDRLKDDTARQCLLYCCLFAEDHEIAVEQLVECWVGEGFLDTVNSDGLDRARNRGLGIIRKLKAACLLEGGRGDQDSFVKLHDVVREMAVWLTGGEYDRNNTFLVDAGKGLSCLPRVHRWADAKRVSLTGNEIGVLPSQFCLCGNLSTLLINLNPLRVVPGGFLGSMPSLRVLDLSCTDILELPKEIGLLAQLQQLNLSGTRIASLPREMATLVRLRQLDLRETYELSRIPCDAIRMLAGLQALNLRESGYSMEGLEAAESDMASLWDLEANNSLCRLEELGLDVLHSSASLERLIGSQRLSRCTKYLRVRAPRVAAEHLCSAFENLVNLRELRVGPCPAVEELRMDIAGRTLWRLEVLELNGLGAARFVIPAEDDNDISIGSDVGRRLPPPPLPGFLERLRSLCILHCHGFKNLTWVKYLPCLESMQLAGCSRLEELILVDGGGKRTGVDGSGVCDSTTPCRKLKFMSLIGLPALRSISRQPLLFPCLEKLHVCQCPRLTSLAMGAGSGKEIREIVGEGEWWIGLEWDDSSIQNTLLPYFRPSTDL